MAGTGFKGLGFSFQILGFWFSGLREDLGAELLGMRGGFMVQGFGIRDSGVGIQVSGFGFRVWHLKGEVLGVGGVFFITFKASPSSSARNPTSNCKAILLP